MMIKNFFVSCANKKALVVLHDLVMVMLAWQLAWWARFNFDFSAFDWRFSTALMPLFLVVQLGLLWRFHLHRALWKFASLPDLWNIFRASAAGAIIMAVVLFALFRLDGIPRSVLLFYPILLIFLLGGSRLAYRLWQDQSISLLSAVDKKKVLVIGAGRAGDMLVRDLYRSKDDFPAAILDDNISLTGAEIRGVKIVGAVKDVKEMAERFKVDWIAIAIPSAGRTEMQAIVESCERTRLPIRTLPNIQDINTIQDFTSGLHNVCIEDLLGRERVRLDEKNIQDNICGKCVMITGGGGSIGSVLAVQVAALSPARLILVDNCEYNLYKADQRLAAGNFKIQIQCLLGDVGDAVQMRRLLEQCKPQLIFHAAAYKHVPILQTQPREALKNNICGTRTMLDLACQTGVDKFLLISTDKAVNPSSILGVSKRIAELYTQAVNDEHATQCITVRFGNVLDSAGSVLPLFREQIKNGGPLTVTHPKITRYFMAMSEAVQLILQAAAMGHGGEIFVLDMGEPVRIQYLAEQMILLSGKKPGEDIHISYCGLRPGEKLSEELFYASEERAETAHDKIFLARHSALNKEYCLAEINRLLNNKCDGPDEDITAFMFEFLNALQVNADIRRANNIVRIAE